MKETNSKYKRCVALLGGLILLFLLVPVWVQAGTVVDTLRPTIHKNLNEWNMSGIGGDKHVRVSDQNDGTYIFETSVGVGDWQAFLTGGFSVLNPDSLQLWVRAAYTGGDVGDAIIVAGRGCYEIEMTINTWCISADSGTCSMPPTGTIHSADTITLTDSPTDYYIGTWDSDPCNNGEFFGCGDGTMWDSTCFNESVYGTYYHRLTFLVYNLSVRTGLPSASNRVYEIWIFSFSEAEEEEWGIAKILDSGTILNILDNGEVVEILGKRE